MAQSEKDFSVSNVESGQAMLSISRPFSAKSNRSFKQLVKILGPALKIHLGVVRQAKKVSMTSTKGKSHLAFEVESGRGCDHIREYTRLEITEI